MKPHGRSGAIVIIVVMTMTLIMGLQVTAPRAGRDATSFTSMRQSDSLVLPRLDNRGKGAYTLAVMQSGTEPDGDSGYPHITDNGEYITFISSASNFVAGDSATDCGSRSCYDVFRYKRSDQSVIRVSVSSGGSPANRDSGASDVTADRVMSTEDGRYTVFSSDADNLVPGDSNSASDIFIRDNVLGQTELVSIALGGVAANGPSYWPSGSNDGRYVVFASKATDLTGSSVPPYEFAYLRDRYAGTTVAVCGSLGGAVVNGGCAQPAISAAGGVVAFISDADNLVPSTFVARHGRAEVYVKTLVLPGQTLLSLGNPSPDGVEWINLSSDGGKVALTSYAELVTGDADENEDVFVVNATTLHVDWISVSHSGGDSDGDSTTPFMSRSGSFVAFASDASNIITSDTNGFADIFLRNLSAGSTSRVSVSSAGQQADGPSYWPSVSDDGGYVVFESSATNLIDDDTNAKNDIFLRDLSAGTTIRIP